MEAGMPPSGGLNIKTMKLYSQADRIYNELKQLGYGPDDALRVEVVNEFDSYHYHGTTAMDEAISQLQIGPSHHVIDVGSGLGGAARFLAVKTSCHVTAVELQGDLHSVAADLTRRCGLAKKVRHVHEDFLQDHIGCGPCDFLVSWLVFLHIPDKRLLFDRCRKATKPGGRIYIEDYFQIHALSNEERTVLKEEIYSCGVDTKEQYITHLKQAGFSNIQFDDVTEDWRRYVHSRSAAYREDRSRIVRIHGAQVFREQEQFNASVDFLFQGGNLGGCRIVATVADI